MQSRMWYQSLYLKKQKSMLGILSFMFSKEISLPK